MTPTSTSRGAVAAVVVLVLVAAALVVATAVVAAGDRDPGQASRDAVVAEVDRATSAVLHRADELVARADDDPAALDTTPVHETVVSAGARLEGIALPGGSSDDDLAVRALANAHRNWLQLLGAITADPMSATESGGEQVTAAWDDVTSALDHVRGAAAGSDREADLERLTVFVTTVTVRAGAVAEATARDASLLAEATEALAGLDGYRAEVLELDAAWGPLLEPLGPETMGAETVADEARAGELIDVFLDVSEQLSELAGRLDDVDAPDGMGDDHDDLVAVVDALAEITDDAADAPADAWCGRDRDPDRDEDDPCPTVAETSEYQSFREDLDAIVEAHAEIRASWQAGYEELVVEGYG